MHALKGACALRGSRLGMLSKLTHPSVTGVPFRRSLLQSSATTALCRSVQPGCSNLA